MQLLSVKCHYIISGSVRKAKGSEIIKLLYKGDGFTFVGQFINSAKPYDFELSKTLENRLKELRELADFPQSEAKEPPQKTKQVKTLQELPNSEANKQETPKQPSKPEPEKINWQGTKAQLVHVVEVLIGKGMLPQEAIDQTWKWTAKHFLVKGRTLDNEILAQTSQNLMANKKHKGKPRGGDALEKGIDDALKKP
ncbi:MAG: hypothetical protein HGB11_13125 [Chlorobiales bacterium]|nr:hypothetical protein [Chlorobiales bacterium]